MTENRYLAEEWAFLTGRPWEEAKQLLEKEGLKYEPRLTAAPSKRAAWEGARVIAVRRGTPLIVICAAEDWTIG